MMFDIFSRAEKDVYKTVEPVVKKKDYCEVYFKSGAKTFKIEAEHCPELHISEVYEPILEWFRDTTGADTFYWKGDAFCSLLGRDDISHITTFTE